MKSLSTLAFFFLSLASMGNCFSQFAEGEYWFCGVSFAASLISIIVFTIKYIKLNEQNQTL